MSGTQVDPSDPAHPDHADYLISTNGWRAILVDEPEEPLSESAVENLLHKLKPMGHEECGFITNTGWIVSVINSHGDPKHNFYMDEPDAIDAIEFIYEADEEIMGIWHTHPNGYPWPSPRDIVGWPNRALNWRYFLVSRGDVTEWELTRD